MVFGLCAKQQQRIRAIVVLVAEIVIVHYSFVVGWKRLWPYLSQYLPDYQPLLDVIWNRILEPYAVSLFSVPSIIAFLIILCYIFAKAYHNDVFNTEAEPLTRFAKEFREDRISMQDFEMLRCVLHYKGTLSSYEMEELNKLPMTADNRCNQVYKLLYYLDQKSDGPFKLIETLQEMALGSNWLAEIADTFIKEYCDSDHLMSLRDIEGLSSSHELPGIASLAVKVFTITSKTEKITWRECGLVLNIPEDAVVSNCHGRTLQVQVGVGFGGQIRYPCDSDYHILLSGVYSLTIKGGRLLKPIKAEVQHCAAHDSSMLQFLTAYGTNFSALPYIMVPQKEHTSFSSTSTSGTIDLCGSLLKKDDQSIIFTVCSNTGHCLGVLSRYCVRIFYQTECGSAMDWTAHITVTKDLEICSKFLAEVYPSGEWYSDPSDMVTMCLRDSFTISLPCDHEGIKVGGWHIFPTTSLKISKESLEGSLYRSKMIPHVILRLVWTGSRNDSGTPSMLTYKLPVEGTIEPHICTLLHLYLQNSLLHKYVVNKKS